MNESRGGFLISKIHQLSGRIFQSKLKQYNLEFNSAQGRILFVLWQQDGIPIAELSRKSGLSKKSLTSMLERLEEKGLILRRSSAEDKRITLIELTEKNQALKDIYYQVSNEMTQLFYKGFEEDEVKDFEEKLDRILENLEENQ